MIYVADDKRRATAAKLSGKIMYVNNKNVYVLTLFYYVMYHHYYG